MMNELAFLSKLFLQGPIKLWKSYLCRSHYQLFIGSESKKVLLQNALLLMDKQKQTQQFNIQTLCEFDTFSTFLSSTKKTLDLNVSFNTCREEKLSREAVRYLIQVQHQLDYTVIYQRLANTLQ